MEDSDNKILNEMNIIYDILMDSSGDDLLSVSNDLTPDDFIDPRNRIIFKTILDMFNKDIKPDIATLTSELKNLQLFDEIGGLDYLNQIFQSSLGVSSVQGYVKQVKDKSLITHFIDTLKKITDEAVNKPIDNISEFIGTSETEILKITRSRRAGFYVGAGELSDDLVTNLVKQTKDFKENGVKPNGVTGVPTGYSEMDQLTKGWHKGDMVVIGARPSVGKTAFAIQLLYKVAKRGTPVLFFSLEMSSLSIAMRLLEMTSGLSSDEINSFDFLEKSTKEHILVNTKSASEAAEVAKLQRGMDELAALPFYINDNPGSRMMDISVNCQKIKNSIPKLGLIAIDYLGLITSQARKGGQDSRQQEVADISRQIKQLARTLEVPIIALSQLSRDTEKRQDHAPQLSDLRDSGAIEQDADMIFMLYREDYYSKGNEKEDEASAVTESNNPISQVRISLLKNRNGAIGYIDFIFDKEHCTFNVATQAHDDEAGI